MFQLFLKSKTALILTVAVIVGALGVIGGGVVLSKETKTQFHADGYLLSVEMDETNQAIPKLVRFTGGTAVRKDLESGYQFKDDNGEMVACSAENLIHYTDGSISSLEGMLLVNMDQFQKGLMDHYYLEGMMVLQNNDTNFSIDNNHMDLTFTNFLLKTGEQNYLVASPRMTLDVGNGQKIVLDNHTAALEYTDDFGSVFRLTDGNGAWQYLSKNCTLTLQNGAVIQLGKMLVHNNKYDEETSSYETQFSLGDLKVSAEAAIQVASASNRVWRPLKFVTNQLDGKEGAEGKEGLAGETGETGQDGQEGIAGAEGAAGAAGKTSAKGTSGKGGSKGKPGNTDNPHGKEDDKDDINYLPSVGIRSWSQDAANVDITLVAYNNETIQPSTTEIYVLELVTGKKYYPVTAVDLSDEGVDDEALFELSFKGLQPKAKYRLVVNADVLKEMGENSTPLSVPTTLLNRDFTMDNLGFFVEKVGARYVTDEDLANDRYEDAEKGAALGLTITLSGNQQLKELSECKVLTEDGTEIKAFSDTEVEKFVETTETGEIFWLYGLPSNTNCTIKMKVELESGKVEEYEVTYLTLKETPNAYDVFFDVNENRYFVSSLKVNDPDQAVQNYTHEVYRYTDLEGATGSCLKYKTTSELSTDFYSGEGIEIGIDYVNKVAVTYFDNEKYITIYAKNAQAWKGQKISASVQPYIALYETEDGAWAVEKERINIQLLVSAGNGNRVYLGSKRILVQFTAANYTMTKTFENLDGWYEIRNGDELYETETGVAEFTGNVVTPYIELTGLTPGTNYIITVTGYIGSQNDGEEAAEQKTIGTATIRTAEQ